MHEIVLDGERIADYFIVAPTEWNFHPQGPLGGWLTTAQLRERDARVFEGAARVGIPLVWNLAGGYQRDPDGGIRPVLAIHTNTAREHLRVFCGH